MMHELGFPSRMVDWVMRCIKIVSYSVLVNGHPKQFKAARGLRQGDPLSSYLFSLCLEYLSRCLETLAYEKGFKFHPRCRRMKITHLTFADDLLLFSYGDRSIDAIWKVFKMFS